MKTIVFRILLLGGLTALLLTQGARAGVVFDSLLSLRGFTYATLAQSTNGKTFYGTTVGDGGLPPLQEAGVYGTVFSFSTNRSPFDYAEGTNLLSFAITEGGGPRAGVILGPGGFLYGTTAFYAISNTLFPTGMGSVFYLRTNAGPPELPPEDVDIPVLLHRFGTNLNSHGQPLDGASPRSVLALGPSNTLFGTTYEGGTNGYSNGGLGYGTVFKVTTNSIFTELHSFLGTDGANPTGLTVGRDTNFYGVTTYGGSHTNVVDTNGDVGYGTIFKITTNGLFTTLYSFGSVTNPAGNALDGSQPNPLVQGTDGYYYGTTAYGGSNATVVDTNGNVGFGTVFKLNTNGTLTTLYSFGSVTNSKGVALDGGRPSGPLIEGPDGNYYGVTEYGGTTNTGTIFAITPLGAMRTLYSFGRTNLLIYQPPILIPPGTGTYPRGGLMLAQDGTLYGTTYSGGDETDAQGSIFHLTPAAPNIPNPPANVTAVAGSANAFTIGVNSIYAMSYQWAFDGTNLTDGGEIAGSLTTDLSLTGVKISDAGTYSITASNLEGSAKASLVLSVVPALITRQPIGGTIVAGSTNTFVVGVTSVFPVSYQWQFDGTNLIDVGEVSGSTTSNLTISGALPADSGTYSVVVSNSAGFIRSSAAVLRVQPFTTTATPGNLTIMAGATAHFGITVQNTGTIYYQWQFDGANMTDSANIAGSATSSLTITNASPFDSGTYSVIVSNAEGTGSWTALLTVIPQTAAGCSLASLHTFTAATDGGQPNGLTLGSDGAFYGSTIYGGTNSSIDGGLGGGTIFKYTQSAGLKTLYFFTGGADQADPNGTLVQGSNGLFYGATWSEIGGQDGTLFDITTNGTLATLVTFDSTNGADPNGVTLGTDGNLYGTTYAGGVNGTGTMFKLDPSNGVFDTLVPFSALTGFFPLAPLALGSDGNFYGTATSGGSVFQADTNGTIGFDDSFIASAQGTTTEGALVQGSDGAFYGARAFGGAYNGGTLFKFTTNGVWTTLYSFGGVTNWDGSALDGLKPVAALVAGPDGNLYGSTYSGGYSNCGTVFKITTNGVLTTLAWLNGSNGSGPAAPLVLGTDGNFYGTTQNGGPDNSGAIFQLALSLPTPGIQAVGASAGAINLSWNVTPGQIYQVQFTADVSQGQWFNLGAPTVATSTTFNATDPLNQSQRFYRLVWLQTY